MSPISWPPRGMTSRAPASPTRKIPYRPAGVARPSAISRGPTRTRRACPPVARASPPRMRPVAVMRSQNRSRGPRNVRPNAANATPMPSARSFTRSAGEKGGDHQPDDQQIAERGVELGGLQIDHRNRALLSSRAKLRGSDLPDEERQRQHREQGPGREQPEHDARRQREIGPDDERHVEPVRGGTPSLHREGLVAGPRGLAAVP